MRIAPAGMLTESLPIFMFPPVTVTSIQVLVSGLSIGHESQPPKGISAAGAAPAMLADKLPTAAAVANTVAVASAPKSPRDVERRDMYFSFGYNRPVGIVMMSDGSHV
ncbi:hypothetical protein ACQGAO_03485 [Rhodococcus sp. 1.20]